MKTIYVILCTVLLTCCLAKSQSTIPRKISYQGVLTDTSGMPRGDGSYTIIFRLYELEIGGIAVWSETKNLQIKRGLFPTILGDHNPFGSSLKFDRQYWLGIQVNSEPELSPRILLTAAGYSIAAINADSSKFSTSALHSETAAHAYSADYVHFSDTAFMALNISDNSITQSKIVDSIITSSKIASGQVIKSLNAMKDDIFVAAQGGATITSNGDTIIITAGSGTGGIGVQGIQNTNSTLDVINPVGPTVTINVKNNGIGSLQIASSSISTEKLSANSVTSDKITDSTITDIDISNSASISPSKISGIAWTSNNDGSGSGLNADILDGYHVVDIQATDFGRSGVATDLYEGTSRLQDKYLSRFGPEQVSSNNETALFVNATGNSTSDMIGLHGFANNTSTGNSIGGYFSTSDSGTGYHYGMYGEANGSSSSYTLGSYGYALNSMDGVAYGGYFGVDSIGTGAHYGVWGEAYSLSNTPTAIGSYGYASNNMLGQEVLTVLDEQKVAGRYDLRIDGTNLASSVYFYRLVAGNYISTKKFILMK